MGGIGLVLASGTAETPPPGTHASVAFRIPDADGVWRDVTAAVRVAHVASLSDDEQRVGLAFADPTSASLDPVVEFLTIDRRLVALGRRVPNVDDDAWPGLV